METSFLEQLLLILGVPVERCTITYKHLHRVLNKGHWLGRFALPARSPMHPGLVELGSIFDEKWRAVLCDHMIKKPGLSYEYIYDKTISALVNGIKHVNIDLSNPKGLTLWVSSLLVEGFMRACLAVALEVVPIAK